MDIAGWDQRYRSAQEREGEPTPLLIETAKELKPGRALDLACGVGRNALWLAEHGWSVTAVDGSKAAIDTVERQAAALAMTIDVRLADLSKGEYSIENSSWDLIAICYYLQRDLFEPAKCGVKPGGLLLAIVHITESGEDPTEQRLRPGELTGYFRGWDILHRYEGKPNDRAHKRPVAEIVARKPQ
jgi:tellurite methyltransferase